MNNDNDNNSNRKRPFGATFRTLNDITNNTNDDIGGGGDGVATAASNTKKIVVQHIRLFRMRNQLPQYYVEYILSFIQSLKEEAGM